MIKSTSLVVSSCDKFQDVWNIFFTLFFRYWPDCPFPVFLVANYRSCADDRVKTILVGEDRGWASNMRQALAQIPGQYVIYLQEDYFLEAKVDTLRIMRLLECMHQRRVGCLRLYPCPGPDLANGDSEELAGISREAPYRVSLQSAIWDKEVLQSILVDGESGWDMEIQGTERSRALDVPFLSVKRDPVTNRVTDPALPYLCTAIVRGRWDRRAVSLCQREGILLDMSKRPVETPWQEFWRTNRALNFARKKLMPFLRQTLGLGKNFNS